MAPSSIPGAGSGVFVTKDVPKGTEFFGGDVAVPLLDVSLYFPNFDVSFINYMWAADTHHSKFEAWEVDMIELSPLGTLANHHDEFHNLSLRPGPHDDTRLHRAVDREAGAFSYHGGERYFAKYDLKAGSELYQFYGESWFNDRFGKLAKIPKTISYESEASITGDGQVNEAKDSQERRPVEWIKEHGICLDTLESRPSTISNAGKGAFAKFAFSKGDRIAPIPLLHVMDKERFALRSWNVDDSGQRVTGEQIIGTQLLLNYCFGHPESTLLLCHTTNAALINHRTAKTNQDEMKPNAMIQWAKGADSNWLGESLATLQSKMGRGLMFDLIATRDIRKGEEIFIDYGDEWDRRWNQHLSLRTNLPKANSYKQTDFMNMDFSNWIKTRKQQNLVPYPDNIMTVCVYDFDDEEEEKEIDTTEMSIKQMIEIFGKSGESQLPSRDLSEHRNYFPCIVYEKHDNNTCTVRIFQDVYDFEVEHDEAGLPTILFNYPQSSIYFVNRPYASDNFLDDAFREPIGIPDDMFPPVWRNLSPHV